ARPRAPAGAAIAPGRPVAVDVTNGSPNPRSDSAAAAAADGRAADVGAVALKRAVSAAASGAAAAIGADIAALNIGRNSANASGRLVAPGPASSAARSATRSPSIGID